VQQKDISYFLKLINNEYYKNDKEFLEIIRKLTSQTADFNNKTISLMKVLNEAELIKLEMIKTERELGLSEYEKPYGNKFLKDIKNDVLIYENIDLELQKYAEEFIFILENFFNEDIAKRKEILEKVDVILHFFEDNGINPLNFVITPQRAKVWHILEHDYKSTLKKTSIDLFIEKVRITRLKHLDKVEALKDFYKQKKEILEKIKVLKKENNTEEIEKLEEKLNKDIDFDIQPLLIDTQKIMESLDVMIEEIPQEIDEEQQKELKEFMPVISEYYIDQIYALSGGVSYTNLSKNLKEFQELIDNGASAKVLFEEVEKLQNTIQHLYILHWIAESLLKNILNCYSYKCSLGRTIGWYSKKYSDTKTDFKSIKEAVKFRNKVAHSGYLWKPIEIENAIKSYRNYISLVVEERNFDFEEFDLEILDRKMDEGQQERRFWKLLKEGRGIDEKLISDELKKEAIQMLVKAKWRNRKYVKNYIKQHLSQEFAKKYFDLDYEEVKKYLILAAEKGIIKRKENETIENAALKTFYWCVYNQYQAPKKDINKNVKLLKKYIEQVSDIKFKKGFLGGLFGRI
jgi:hypothetical protein